MYKNTKTTIMLGVKYKLKYFCLLLVKSLEKNFK